MAKRCSLARAKDLNRGVRRRRKAIRYGCVCEMTNERKGSFRALWGLGIWAVAGSGCMSAAILGECVETELDVSGRSVFDLGVLVDEF